MKAIINRHKHYLLAGIVNVGVSYGLFAVLYFIIGHKEAAVTLTTLLMVYISSQIKSKVAFKNKKINHRMNVLTFLLVYCLNIVLLWILVDFIYFNVYFAQAVVMGVVIVFRYFMDRYVVFKEVKA